MSEHEVLVVKVNNIYKHPDPETTELEIVKVWDYEFIVRKGTWKVGDLGVVVEPDYMVPTTPGSLFEFLDTKQTQKPYRVTTKRLRGVWSQGVLVKALEGHKEGQNVMSDLGITRWEPPPQKNGGWGGDASIAAV
jgi:RNA ligase (TIGR02306 family)